MYIPYQQTSNEEIYISSYTNYQKVKSSQTFSVEGHSTQLYNVWSDSNKELKAQAFVYTSSNGMTNTSHITEKQNCPPTLDLLAQLISIDSKSSIESYIDFFSNNGFFIETESNYYKPYISYHAEDISNWGHLLSSITLILNKLYAPHINPIDILHLLTDIIIIDGFSFITYADDLKTEKKYIIPPFSLSGALHYDKAEIDAIEDEIMLKKYEHKNLNFCDSFINQQVEYSDIIFEDSFVPTQERYTLIKYLYMNQVCYDDLSKRLIDFLYNLQNEYPEDFYFENSKFYIGDFFTLPSKYTGALYSLAFDVCEYYINLGLKRISPQCNYSFYEQKYSYLAPDLLGVLFLTLYFYNPKNKKYKPCAYHNCSKYMFLNRSNNKKKYCCHLHAQYDSTGRYRHSQQTEEPLPWL